MFIDENRYIQLNNGRKMPVLGLGTYPMEGRECRIAVRNAYKVGYRLFDTSPAYGNEQEIGKALFKGFKGKINTVFNRHKIFLTSKLFLDACRNDTELESLRATLKNLRTDYLDLWLLHWAEPEKFVKNYKEMEKAVEAGYVRSIGVCNCEIHHLERILNECNIIPVVNQVECHPLLTQKKLITFCNKNNILIESYSPFARMDRRIFDNNILKDLAEKYNKDITQIILRWNIEQDRIVIPKTNNIERMKSNLNVFNFNIEKKDLEIIDSLNKDIRVRFHPDKYPLEN